jgi:hypothetical protein
LQQNQGIPQLVSNLQQLQTHNNANLAVSQGAGDVSNAPYSATNVALPLMQEADNSKNLVQTVKGEVNTAKESSSSLTTSVDAKDWTLEQLGQWVFQSEPVNTLSTDIPLICNPLQRHTSSNSRTVLRWFPGQSQSSSQMHVASKRETMPRKLQIASQHHPVE